jgi:hypothetical protein
MYDNDTERVGHDATDFAAYGLSHLGEQYGNRDYIDTANPSKVDAGFYRRCLAYYGSSR